MTAVPSTPSTASGLSDLIGALNGVKDQLVQLNRPGGGGGAGGGPLGALTGIGQSWGKSAATMAVSWMGHQAAQMVMAGTAGIRGGYDPAGGASMAAAAYDPLGPLKSIPIIGGLGQSMVERERETMTRHASVLGLMQTNNMSAFSENNSLSEQTASQSVALNRQYSPAQAAYQQQMIQPTMLRKKSRERYGMKDELYAEAKRTQHEFEDAWDPITGEITKRAATKRAYDQAQSKYNIHAKGLGEQQRKDSYTGTLEAQAAEAYKQATIGQYTPMEQANLGSVAIAAKLGGVPTLDTAVSDMEITNTTLLDIKNLIKGYMDGK
jgi:hypothetical protein